MGILNSKTRIMDIQMTPIGRAGLAAGGLEIAYASFTDGQAYYDPSSISGSYDFAVDRIYLDCPSSLPQDTLAMVTDDSGKIIPGSAFGTDYGSDGTLYTSISGSLYSVTEGSVVGTRAVDGLVSGSGFSSAVNDVINMFQTSFGFNSIIGSRMPLDDTPDFIISPTTASFTLSDETANIEVDSINTADSLFFDRRFSNFTQFKFLPPVTRSGNRKRTLGSYSNIKQRDSYTYGDIKRETLGTDRKPVKQRFDVEIAETSFTNDMVMQMYEITPGGLTKLDAFDYGEINDPTDPTRPSKRIVYFGKVFVDDTDAATYINLFTVVID